MVAADAKVQAALRLLKEDGHLDILHEGVGGPKHPARRAPSGVVAAVLGHIGEGWTFCRHLGVTLAGRQLPHHHVRLRVGVKEDLRSWCVFLKQFNGIPLKTWEVYDWDVQIFSDAAGGSGFGVYWEGKYCAETWPAAWTGDGRSIAFLKLFPLVVAVCIWGHFLEHHKELFRDNDLAVVQVVNRQSAREAQVLQLL
ncbi:hypothetical protein NDU88_006741 [Pleurodeles waltl]|uniref:Uncharacterized protein n=1 Tax=Pleurodeles waltl TaxID=8319 RepID=A0AAV7TXN8_PLEWA|nr:hypothetical protein NDU88_006741 [Pleurodeles waltl]